MDASATQRRGQARLEIGRKFGVSAVARRHDELAGNAIAMAKLDGGKEGSDVGNLRLRQNGIHPRIVKQELFDVLHPRALSMRIPIGLVSYPWKWLLSNDRSTGSIMPMLRPRDRVSG